MNPLFEAGVRGRILELQELYTQQFILLEESLARGAAPAGSGEASSGLREPIAELMESITIRSRAFKDFLSAEGDWPAACDADLREEVEKFQSDLRVALEAMHHLVQGNIADAERAREELKLALKNLQDKKRTLRTYQKKAPVNPVSTLLSSEA